MDKLGEAVQLLAQNKKNYSIPAKVTKINNNNTIDCEPLNGDAPFLQCRLNAVENSQKGIIIMPALNPIVMLTKISDTKTYVTMYSEIDTIIFNEGKNGGLIKLQELVTKINNMENKINSIINTLNTVVIPLAPVGTYPFAPVFASITNLIATQKSELENDKIKH